MVMVGRIAKASAVLKLPVVACRHISRSPCRNGRLVVAKTIIICGFVESFQEDGVRNCNALLKIMLYY
jgi:hypothetical protein